MPRKKSSSPTEIVALDGVNRHDILRIIYDKVDMEPPVGERYEFLLRKIIDEAIEEYGKKLTETDREALADELFAYVASYGPIEQYFTDPHVSEIMVNGPEQIFVERNGQMNLTDLRFEVSILWLIRDFQMDLVLMLLYRLCLQMDLASQFEDS